MIEQNVKRLFESIEEVKYSRGISRDISVVAATKYASADEIVILQKCGITSAGENRVQDFLKKFAILKGMEAKGQCGAERDSDATGTYTDVHDQAAGFDTRRNHPSNRPLDWQFIGQLQTNKVKYIIDKVSLIQSVDRHSLAEEINKECFKKGIVGNILIEVNIGGELSKGGIAVDNLFSFAEEIRRHEHLSVSGLMCIAPLTDTPEKNRKFYLQMNEFYDTLNIKFFDKKLRFLSMGMSGDYLTAIECGANMIRPGSIIFGR